ncbi:Heavy metal ATPase 2 [Rhynchospora pubera]|uniref:Heavy metal ATPase 2 n=1 Tax=Rhynchospora pubera TaxID=906938 RepID=A0AAV8HMV8_9POAL|nr:Heavy metal ATPase 2 [Rhynchospora pubera]
MLEKLQLRDMGGDGGFLTNKKKNRGGKQEKENEEKEVMNTDKSYQKSYFDVLGICCPSEVPLIERILKPLEGVQGVSVIVPSRTVVVVHDPLLISPSQIVKALNQARLEASIRAYGGEKILNAWPSPYIILCAILLVVSLFKMLYHPLRWFAIGAAVVGLPPIVMRSIVAIRRLTLDINILLVIAVCGAIALGDYSEAGFIVFLFTTAEWLETLASHKATAGMTSLMSMAPQKAVLEETGETVDVGEVKINSLIAVKAGEIIPIDGVVVEGRSEVDERSLTGESFPVPKQAGSQVWAGTLNIDGYLSVRTSAMAENSAVARMARLVEEAQSSRSNTQRLIDTCAKYYTPAVVFMSAGVAFIPLMMKLHNRQYWFRLALVLLVSACPCALVLSTPIATFCALLRAARMGLLVKGGDVLEALSRVKVAAFDKTGTITRGEFTVREFWVLNSDISLQTLLYWVSSVESKSSHPMASALVEYARLNSVEPKPDDVSEFLIFPGEGIFGQIDGKDIYVGNKRIVARASSGKVPSMEGLEGVTVGYLVYGRELVAVFTLSDSCRTGSKEAIRKLKSLGIKSVMLTGDSTTAANFAQNQLNNALEEIHAELLPADKVRVINDLKTRVGPAMMVGDGMNDAPALATANVGISMGVSGSAVATETSHITLMSNDIRRIPLAIRLARQTHRTVLVNIIFSVATKIAILGLALGGHPLLWAAVLADVGTCLLVIFNSMTLLRDRDMKVKKKKCCRSSKKRLSSKSDKSCAKQNCCDSHIQVKHCHSPSHSHAKQNCCDSEAYVKHSHSPSHAHPHSHIHSPKCNGARVSEENERCLTSCHDHDHAAEAEPQHYHSNCCDKPKGQANTQQEHSHSHSSSHSHCHPHHCNSHSHSHSHHHSDSHSHSHAHSESNAGKCKEETNEKGNSCQGAHKTCHDEIKKLVLEGCWCDGVGSSGMEVLERRTGGCCSKSYMEEVVRREGHANGCCENGIVKLPEIITE